MAYTGELRQESAGAIHGWACDYCGLKAETSKRESPQEWYDGSGRSLQYGGSFGRYPSSSLYCTERCHAKWNKKPWPPEKEEDELEY
jgi:hypothetical protein